MTADYWVLLLPPLDMQYDSSIAFSSLPSKSGFLKFSKTWFVFLSVSGIKTGKNLLFKCQWY